MECWKIRSDLVLVFWLLLVGVANPSLTWGKIGGLSQPIKSAEASITGQIEIKLGELEDLIARKSFKQASVVTLELDELRRKGGFSGFDASALRLVEQAHVCLMQLDYQGARVLWQAATILAPKSSRVLLAGVPIVREVEGVVSSLKVLGKSVLLALTTPITLLSLVSKLIYPVLWAATLGLYITLVLMLLMEVPQLLRQTAQFFPPGLRGSVSSILVLALLLLPCLMGPFICLVVWACALGLLVPKRRSVALVTGLLLIGWGTLAPVRENLHDWFEEPAVGRLLALAAGAYEKGDVALLKQIESERPGDGVVKFLRGQLARKSGLYTEAHQHFEAAEVLLGDQPWTVMERGLTAYLAGSLRRADQLLDEVENRGVRTPRFYLVRSKVKADLLDMSSSRKYFELARKENPKLIRRQLEQDGIRGAGDPPTVEDIRLPISVLWHSVKYDPEGTRQGHIEVNRLFGLALSSNGVLVVGILLSIVFLFIKPQERVLRVRGYFEPYQAPSLVLMFVFLMPGGVMIMYSSWLSGYFILSFVILSLLPIVSWPPEAAQISQYLPGLYETYVGVVFFIVLVLVWISAAIVAEERCSTV